MFWITWQNLEIESSHMNPNTFFFKKLKGLNWKEVWGALWVLMLFCSLIYDLFMKNLSSHILKIGPLLYLYITPSLGLRIQKVYNEITFQQGMSPLQLNSFPYHHTPYYSPFSSYHWGRGSVVTHYSPRLWFSYNRVGKKVTFIWTFIYIYIHNSVKRTDTKNHQRELCVRMFGKKKWKIAFYFRRS